MIRSSAPYDVALAYRDHYGIQHVYVADLDAIGGQPPDLQSIEAISAAGMQMILDAGVRSAQQVHALLNHTTICAQLQGLVVPLESTVDASHWPSLVELIGVDRAVFSLDLQGGRPLSSVSQLAQQTPLEIADHAWNAGFRRLIALDLQSVGTGQGPSTLQLCRALSQQHTWSELISGGGVRNTRDLRALEQAGCDCALLASALRAVCGRGGEGV